MLWPQLFLQLFVYFIMIEIISLSPSLPITQLLLYANHTLEEEKYCDPKLFFIKTKLPISPFV